MVCEGDGGGGGGGDEALMGCDAACDTEWPYTRMVFSNFDK